MKEDKDNAHSYRQYKVTDLCQNSILPLILNIMLVPEIVRGSKCTSLSQKQLYMSRESRLGHALSSALHVAPEPGRKTLLQVSLTGLVVTVLDPCRFSMGSLCAATLILICKRKHRNFPFTHQLHEEQRIYKILA